MESSCNSITRLAKRRRCAAVWAIMLCACATGCGDGRPERAAVSGKVSIDGMPLTKGAISFIPVKGRQASGAIDSEGRYVLSCFEKGDGAILGEYQVTVNGVEYVTETLMKWHAPKKYGSIATSGLAATIDGPRDDLDFELTWDGGKPFEEKTR
jgi:hypothetical protein